MNGKDVPKADIGAAIATLVVDTSQLCNDLALSLSNYPEIVAQAEAALQAKLEDRPAQ